MRLLFSVLFVLFTTQNTFAVNFGLLAPHRAVYDVKLVEAKDRSGIENMKGRIVYELKGNACEGISIHYRFVTRITSGGQDFVTDQQSASYESPDGNEFSFSTKSFVNNQPDQDITGAATLNPDGLQVSLTGKNPHVVKLDKAIFATTHLIDIMESAKNGETFVSHTVFDGSGDADQLLSSATVIGKEKTVENKLEGEGEEGLAPLLNAPAWPVTMSYFNKNMDNTAEAMPIYEASFLLYENGITRDLTMRYNDYELKATLSEVEYLDAGDCE